MSAIIKELFHGWGQCFDFSSVLGEWWDVGVVVWDEVQTRIQPSRCHCHSLSLAPVNPDWF